MILETYIFNIMLDDKDILFQTDNNYGNTTNYLQLDGSELRTAFNATRFNDNNRSSKFSSSDDMNLSQ